MNQRIFSNLFSLIFAFNCMQLALFISQLELFIFQGILFD